MIQIREIDRAHAAHINLPNEPFPLFGRMIPSFDGTRWDYSTEKFPTATEMCFPEENYDFDAMQEQCFFLGAYEGETCVGVAILEKPMFKYLYLSDLKVAASHRRQGVGRKLLDTAYELARIKGYLGVYTIGQDNNLGACLLYTSCGFEIGGLDTRVYDGTSQAGKADIYFYRR